MDEKLTQAVDNPVAAADEAKKESSSQAPTADAEQGVGPAEASDTRSETPHTADTPDTQEPTETSQVSSEAQADTEQPSDEGSSRPATATEASNEASQAASEGEPAQTPSESGAATQPESARDTIAAAAASGQGDRAEQAEAGETDSAAQTADAAQAESPRDMTMEDVMAASDDQITRKPIHRGMLVTGQIIMLSQEGLVVDVGAKIEGVVPYNQLFEHEVKQEEAAKYFKSGDEIQVYVIRADIPNSTIILSKKRADQERAWNLLNDIYEKKLPVEVEIVEKVRGGLVANLGVRAFLPASQVDVRRVNDLAPYVGKRLKVRIIELNRKRNRVIISRRSIIEDEIAEQKQETLKKLEPGAKLEGEVVEITDFGAFVNLGGVDGLVHRSELSHGRFNHPREVVKLGDKVKVEILDMDLERERINLSMKSLITDPWENVLANYHIGQKISGKVTNLMPFGAFVEIEPGLEGLIHVSEMSWTKRVRHPKEIVEEGDDVEAMILKIDIAQKRISLGLRQTQPDPWSSLPDRFPPGTEVTGPITGITEFGVFMELEEGIEGLVHISELAHEHIEDISQHFGRGDEINAVVLNIDPVEKRASLSRKRLLPYTAGDGDMASSGAPAGGRSGGRKGRRGGRRGAGIDYDYSYAAGDSGSSRATTKLGDVYADLFAQFGLTDKGGSEQEGEQDDAAQAQEAPQAETTQAEPSAESQTRTPEAEKQQPSSDADASADKEEAATAEASSEAKTEAPAPEKQQAQPKEAATASASDEATSDENAIDAAEAAAMLTAAFRQGKRPSGEQAKSSEEPQEQEGDEDEEKEKEIEKSEA